jgi:hypothetical protein
MEKLMVRELSVTAMEIDMLVNLKTADEMATVH